MGRAGGDEYGYTGGDIMKKPTAEELEALLEDPRALFYEEVVPRVACMYDLSSKGIGSGNFFMFVAEDPGEEDEEDEYDEASSMRYGLSRPGDGEMPYLFRSAHVCREVCAPRYAIYARMVLEMQGMAPEESLREIIRVYGAKPAKNQAPAAAETRKKLRQLAGIIHTLMQKTPFAYSMVYRKLVRGPNMTCHSHGYSKWYPAINLLSVLATAPNPQDIPAHLGERMRASGYSPGSDMLYTTLAPLCGETSAL